MAPKSRKQEEGEDAAAGVSQQLPKKARKAETAWSASSTQGQQVEDVPDLPDSDEDFEGSEEEEDEDIIDEGMEEEEEDDENAADGTKRVFRPGIDNLEDGEQLDVEPGTYDMLHRAQVEWPCLSFDILRDELGAQRTTYPMTAYIVAGTQAEQFADNRIYLMKWHKLFRTSKDGREEDSEDEEDSSDGDDHEAELGSKTVPHPGPVNRIRSMPQAGHIIASWAESGKVHMWNLQGQLKALDKADEKPASNPKPIFTFENHKQEGFALDFNPHVTGQFLSGDNTGSVFLWDPVPGGWSVGSDKPFRGHTGSVEDVHWKRDASTGRTVFASCGSDCSVRVWDVREPSREKAAQQIAKAHNADVNVISWSPCVADLLVSGSDDGGFKIWDIRNVAAGAMANFRWHKKPITSVSWHPSDDTCLSVASADDTVSLWDMAVEDDAVGREDPPGAEHFPSQLLFQHQGQRDVKELQWHPQLPGVCVTTAASGFNIFKTCNI